MIGILKSVVSLCLSLLIAMVIALMIIRISPDFPSIDERKISADFEQLSHAIEDYQQQTGHYPPDLSCLVEQTNLCYPEYRPYLSALPVDPWQKNYQYQRIHNTATEMPCYFVWTLGEQGKAGGRDPSADRYLLPDCLQIAHTKKPAPNGTGFEEARRP